MRAFSHPITALVQGASRGIGLGLVEQLLDDPGVEHVLATSRNPEGCEALQALARTHAQRLHLHAIDVTDEASIARAAGEAAARFQRVDMLINCAGLLHDAKSVRPERRLADLDPEAVMASFRVNALGVALVAKHFQGMFHRSDRAVFASISARVGSIGDNRLGGWYAYRASKAAQNMITRNLSIELRRRARGIICVGLHPGTVDTQLSRPFQANVPPERLFSTRYCARALLNVLDGLDGSSNGGFYAFDGSVVPW